MIETINDLNKMMCDIRDEGWVEGVLKGTSGVGLTLEKKLGISVNDLSIPDYNGIEIKCKTFGGRKFFTLFNVTPDSNFFEIKRLHEKYGYPDKTYPQFKVFNVTITQNSNKYIGDKYIFKLFVDYCKGAVVLRISNINGELIDDLTSWSFKELEARLYRKLQHLLVVHVSSKNIKGVPYYKYISWKFYKLRKFDNFLRLIENGKIRITFQISVFKSGKRYGQIHDHGTSFEIEEMALNQLFFPYPW